MDGIAGGGGLLVAGPIRAVFKLQGAATRHGQANRLVEGGVVNAVPFPEPHVASGIVGIAVGAHTGHRMGACRAIGERQAGQGFQVAQRVVTVGIRGEAGVGPFFGMAFQTVEVVIPKGFGTPS